MAETLQRWKNISREYRYFSLRPAISRSFESCVSTFEVPVSLSFRKQLCLLAIFRSTFNVCGYCRSSTKFALWLVVLYFYFNAIADYHTHTYVHKRSNWKTNFFNSKHNNGSCHIVLSILKIIHSESNSSCCHLLMGYKTNFVTLWFRNLCASYVYESVFSSLFS